MLQTDDPSLQPGPDGRASSCSELVMRQFTIIASAITVGLILAVLLLAHLH